MPTDQPRSSSSSTVSRRGGVDRKPESWSATAGSGLGAGAGFATDVRRFGGLPPEPDEPAVRENGRSLPRFNPLAQEAAAMDTEPAASPNCASIDEWLDGIRPYCHLVAVRAVISNGAREARPNCSTRLAAWKAPQT